MDSGSPGILIVFGGLPATGKTTIARELTIRLSATYLRIDTIEQALRAAGRNVGALGYVIANELAADNLKLGRTTIVDCVNPVLASRQGWRETALHASARIAEIELVCSDAALHRQRAETRSPDIAGLRQPTWDEIATRRYEPWDREHLVLDTASSSLAQLVESVEAYVSRCCDARVGSGGH
ncbi:AAA family ATPase [Bradyrhizobium sp. HKCCYLS20291]|uniref:AAA family ATPase n=1 Tax=Bradyrhizobium sp. HKCCYLS20291 TaxID=3420766 RepID=UPI003EB7A0DD